MSAMGRKRTFKAVLEGRRRLVCTEQVPITNRSSAARLLTGQIAFGAAGSVPTPFE
jgi:hypothetical protein